MGTVRGDGEDTEEKFGGSGGVVLSRVYNLQLMRRLCAMSVSAAVVSTHE